MAETVGNGHADTVAGGEQEPILVGGGEQAIEVAGSEQAIVVGGGEEAVVGGGNWNVDGEEGGELLLVVNGDEQELIRNDLMYSTPDGKQHRMVDRSSGQIAPPAVGMVFSKLEEVGSYFKNYAKQQGFGIIKANSARFFRKGQYTDELRNYTFRCERSGKKDTRVRVDGRKVSLKSLHALSSLHSLNRKGAKLVTRQSKKVGCPVRVYATRTADDDWVIAKVVLEHVGHEPTPSKTKFVSMYRQEEINNNPSVQRRLFNDVASGGKVSQSFQSLVVERHGLANTIFTERDLRNVVAKKKREKMKAEGGDANAMINYFRKMAADNKKFYHAERFDASDKLKDVMWVDARSQAAYQEFSDVVCFDSTYITNKFNLPFAIFVGVNHHGQTILFGCALLSHENTETFEWLFNSWLTCMGHAPDGILTDQCQAMRKALATTMPDTRHRWCLWHILKKMNSKLGCYTNYGDIIDELQAAIYDSMTVDEFEHSWTSVISKYNLEENEWLSGLYEEREMWIPAYMKHMFWAGMKTTQRSESINSFFDGYVKKKTMLHEFAAQYFRAMESRVDKEERADADANRNLLELVSEIPIEAQFQKLYTPLKFREIQIEILKLMYVMHLSCRNISEHVFEHVIRDRIYYRDKTLRKDVPSQKTREYVVSYDSKTGDAVCLCGMMEAHGIICRHLISVFGYHEVKKVPDSFILRRWCKEVQRSHAKVPVKYHDHEKTEVVKRYDRGQLEFDSLCHLAAEGGEQHMDNLVALIRETMSKLKLELDGRSGSKVGDNIVVSPTSVGNKRGSDEVSPVVNKKLNCSPGVQESVGNIVTPTTDSVPTIIKDPPSPKKAKHRTTDSRYKSAAELNSSAKSSGGKKKGTNDGGKKKGKKAKDKEEDTTAKMILSVEQQQAILMFMSQQMCGSGQHVQGQHVVGQHVQAQPVVGQPVVGHAVGGFPISGVQYGDGIATAQAGPGRGGIVGATVAGRGRGRGRGVAPAAPVIGGNEWANYSTGGVMSGQFERQHPPLLTYCTGAEPSRRTTYHQHPQLVDEGMGTERPYFSSLYGECPKWLADELRSHNREAPPKF